MPRVLRIINRLNLGGPTFNAAYLTKYLAPEFETRLLAGLKDESEASSEFIVRDLGLDPSNIPNMHRALNPFKDGQAYRTIRQAVREFKPDIVHTHAAKAGALGRLAAIQENVPVILHTFHGHVFHSYFHPLKTRLFLEIERWLAKRSSCIIAISEVQRRELCEEFRIAPPDKFAVVPLGFDLNRFHEDRDAKRARFRAEFQVPDDTLAIAIVGRLVPIKNHAMFLKGLKHVLQHTRRPIRAFIVGDGESRAEVEQTARGLGIPFSIETDAVHDKPLVFTSWRRDVDVVYAGADLVALTSLNEGTPVSLIEAQAANRPIVSTRVGGIADVVIEGETALLCASDDTEGFGRLLLELVENDAKRLGMGQSGFEHVMAKYHYTRLVEDVRALYHRLLDEARRKP
jgi:glycosyltransferase involved in cell wall biosynthesis